MLSFSGGILRSRHRHVHLRGTSVVWWSGAATRRILPGCRQVRNDRLFGCTRRTTCHTILICRHVRAHGGLVVIDEVQTGYGRIGSKFWAHQMYEDGEYTAGSRTGI